MSKFILGSGIIGLIARHILGDEYAVIPFKKSRYYSFPLPVADNDITHCDATREILTSLHIPEIKAYFPTAVSMAGGLFFNKSVWVDPVVDKMYGGDTHPLAAQLLSKDADAYPMIASKLYGALLEKYSDEITKRVNDEVTLISKNKIVLNGEAHSYDKIISTIPLNALLSLTKLRGFLNSKDYHVFLVATDQFNLEGAKRCYIADAAIPFWKVNVIDDRTYQFFANGVTEGADIIFSMLTKGRFKTIASTTIKEAFPCGPPQIELLNRLKEDNIECVGSNARWDYFCDIATSIGHILKFRNV